MFSELKIPEHDQQYFSTLLLFFICLLLQQPQAAARDCCSCLRFISAPVCTTTGKTDSVNCSQDSLALVDSTFGRGSVLQTNLGLLLEDSQALITAPLRIKTRHLWKLGTATAVLGLVYAHDQQLLDALQRQKHHRFYRNSREIGLFLEPAGLVRNLWPFYVGGLAGGYLVGYQPLEKMSAQLLEILIFDGVIRTRLLRRGIGRYRPLDERGPYFFKFRGGYSFPSGHTANIFQLATVLSHHLDSLPLSFLLYGGASTVALQRLDEEMHWPSDVLVGAIYGIVISKAVIHLHEKRKLRLSMGTQNGIPLYSIILTF